LKILTKKRKYLFWGLFLGIFLHWLFNLVIILIGGEIVIYLSIFLFVVTIFLLWAFDILKQIEKPIKI